MADIVSKEKRSRMMSGIRSKNTRPELLIRRALHRAGFRFRLHAGRLPGRPDLVFPKYKAAIFIHGCFWHGHDCKLFKAPQTRAEFWRAKIDANRRRDASAGVALRDQGWRVASVWECALKGPTRLSLDEVIQRCAKWLRSGAVTLEVTGYDNDLDAI